MKQTFSLKRFFGFALIALAAIACRREPVQTPSAANAPEANDDNRAKNRKPGHYIKASEGLTIPAAVAVPEGSTRIATYYAEGVQQYKAQDLPGYPGVYQWVFIRPVADLYAHNNHLVGTHGAGPHWTLSAADSIFGQHFAPARFAFAPLPNSIDWLLLKPKAGTTPTGIFKDVRYIQRIATEGGKAPDRPPVSLAQTADVPYKAVYRFSK